MKLKDTTPSVYNQLFKKPLQEYYYTPQSIFDLGMCYCDNCGKLNSIDNSYCVACMDQIVILLDRPPVKWLTSSELDEFASNMTITTRFSSDF